MMKSVAILVSAFALVGVSPDVADACSLFGNEVFEVVPDVTDTVAPTLEVPDWSMGRSDRESTCAGVRWLEIDAVGTDDRSDGVGFEVSIVSGNFAPFNPTEGVFSHSLSGALAYYVSFEQPRVDAMIEVRAVDRAGNRSEPVVLHVVEPELDDEGGGCSTGGGGGGAGGALLLCLAAVAARMMRR